MALQYLLTGLPRIRSAWFAALLSTDSIPCYHSVEHPEELTGEYGISDPGAIALYSDWAFWASASVPVVIVTRDSAESRKSLERWSGITLSQDGWEAILERYDAFLDDATPMTLYVPYGCLEDYAAVAMIHKHLTGRPLSRTRFDILNGLKIEQHLDKAKARDRSPSSPA
jgi:hypothetical protein